MNKTPTNIADKDPSRRFDLEAFKAESLGPNSRAEMFAEIERKRVAGVLLSTQEQAFLEEDAEAREVDPYAEFESYMGDVFTALKGGAISAETAEFMLSTMLQRQRRIYSLTKQQDALRKEQSGLGRE